MEVQENKISHTETDGQDVESPVTIDISKQLWRRAKAAAAINGEPMKAFVAKAIRSYLEESSNA